MQASPLDPRNSTSRNMMFRSPTRITITLPHNTFCNLRDRSDQEGRSVSNLAAYLLENSLRRENA